MIVRTLTELQQIDSYEDRYEYLRLRGVVGEQTFGSERYLNQGFYTSREWRELRHQIIVRDNGLDLGVPGYEISGKVYVHHMNPMTPQDIIHGRDSILDPEYLICVSHRTHNALHYGQAMPDLPILVERKPGDTLLWKNGIER